MHGMQLNVKLVLILGAAVNADAFVWTSILRSAVPGQFDRTEVDVQLQAFPPSGG